MPKPKQPAQSCRTCVHFDLDAAKDARGRVLSAAAVRCKYPFALVRVPEAARWLRRALEPYLQPTPESVFTYANHGQQCPTWAERRAVGVAPAPDETTP